MSRNLLLLDAVKRGKYSNLFKSLVERQDDEWQTNFAELEALLGFRLPNSARIYRPWWANDIRNGHSQSMAWTVAGWKTAAVDLDWAERILTGVGWAGASPACSTQPDRLQRANRCA